jgi:hypothetical protein
MVEAVEPTKEAIDAADYDDDNYDDDDDDDAHRGSYFARLKCGPLWKKRMRTKHDDDDAVVQLVVVVEQVVVVAVVARNTSN